MGRRIVRLLAGLTAAGLTLAANYAMGLLAPEGGPELAVGPGVLAGIYLGGAAIGALGSLSGNKSAKTQAKRSRKLLRRGIRRARQTLTPQFIGNYTRQLLPQIRSSVAAGIGPQFQQNVATLLARRGLTGTGVGTALQSAALAAPGIFAVQQALPYAYGLAQARANAELGSASQLASIQPQLQNPFSGAAQGLFLAGQGLNNQPRTPTLPVTSNSSGMVAIPAGNAGNNAYGFPAFSGEMAGPPLPGR